MMEMIAGLFAAAGGQIAAVIAGIVAVVGALFYHKTKVSSAERAGRDDGASIERERIKQDTEKATEHLEQRADEIEREINDSTADPDDLRQRMRDAAASDHRAK